MLQKPKSQQPSQHLIFSRSQSYLLNSQEVSDDQLRISLSNINQIMEKINEAVKKSQNQRKQIQENVDMQEQITFVTQENLMTENVDTQETQFVKKLKRKMNGLKIPLHQLHKKNKLSTVVEESQSQSGRTHQIITPRDFQLVQSAQIQPKFDIKINNQICTFTKQVVILQNCSTVQQNQLEECERRTKKITGIRKTSNFKINQQTNYQKSTQKQIKPHVKKQQIQGHPKYSKNKSMANIKSSLLYSKRQSTCKEIQSQNETIKSKSKPKKGLSLLSKQSLKGQQSQKMLKNIDNTTGHKNKAASQVSSQTKNSKTIIIKRRTIHPFLLQKKSIQLQKKSDRNEQKNEHKNKNCLSRTNIRQFFVSKRINK